MLTKRCLLKSSIIVILLTSFTSIFYPNFSSVICDNEEKYTYYGVIPNKIYQYVLNDSARPELGYIFEQDVDTVRTRILVSITATQNNTNVWVYFLNNNSLVSQTNLDVMEKYFVLFPNGSMFKVVTDKYASVMILNFPNIPPNSSPNVRDAMPNTYQASINGTYAGKEFIFMASYNTGAGQYQSYRIFAIEKADVKIDENGHEQDYSLPINSYKDISLDTYVSYRIESTGNIMIQAKENQGRGDSRFYYFVPPVEGGFVGKTFFTTSTTDWDATEDYGFRISATQNSEITIWDLDAKGKIMESSVKGGEGIVVQPNARNAIMVQSTEPVTLEWLANGSTTRRTGGDAYGGGIAYIGIKLNEETPFLLPTNSTNEAYIFAYKHTTVTIDNNPVSIEAGSYFVLTAPGAHIINSDQNIVIEIMSWPLYPSFQGLNFGGVEIPCIQLTNAIPNVTITPIEETSKTMYIIIGVAVAALAIGLGYFIIKRRK